ncbi:unnamed protein product [Lota lota]
MMPVGVGAMILQSAALNSTGFVNPGDALFGCFLRRSAPANTSPALSSSSMPHPSGPVLLYKGVVGTGLRRNSVSHAVSPAGLPWQGAPSFCLAVYGLLVGTCGGPASSRSQHTSPHVRRRCHRSKPKHILLASPRFSGSVFDHIVRDLSRCLHNV